MTFLNGENFDDTFLILRNFKELKEKPLSVLFCLLVQNVDINIVLTELTKFVNYK